MWLIHENAFGNSSLCHPKIFHQGKTAYRLPSLKESNVILAGGVKLAVFGKWMAILKRQKSWGQHYGMVGKAAA